MEKFTFINKRQKKNRVFLPKCYDRFEDYISGIYTTNSILTKEHEMIEITEI